MSTELTCLILGLPATLLWWAGIRKGLMIGPNAKRVLRETDPLSFWMLAAIWGSMAVGLMFAPILTWRRGGSQLVLIATCVAALTGCATSYPLGLTRSEWEALPPEKQAEYRARQKIKEAHVGQDAARIRQTADRSIGESLRVESSFRQAADHAMHETRMLESGR